MWVLLKSLLAKWAILKLVLKAFGSLGWLLPLAVLLKALGLPFLLMLALLAIPLLFVLALIGLPFLLVTLVGGVLVTLTLWIVSIGVAALKISIPLILVYWVLRWMWSRGGDATGPVPPTSASTPPDAA
ncbi:MAG: hypothetical protein IT359_09480 [Gemmatimonadaceae bacterium]|nr:hypothetical protein [Gemmatimonadaceae bacterium]